MKISLPIKPLSINQAYYGAHIKTTLCRKYDKSIDKLLIPYKRDIVNNEWYEVVYRFYLKNFGRTDCDNCIKTLQDGLVRNGFLSDDRRIKKITVEKFKAESDRIDVEIVPFNGIISLEGETEDKEEQ